MRIEVGDIVVPRFGCEDRADLTSGASRYEDAVVVSVDPFVLVSRGGDMRWQHTVDPSDFARVDRADAQTMQRVMQRL